LNAIAIIPARMGSTRFPGKVLAAETGKTLIQHVYESARRAGCLARGRVVVATDDERVRAAVLGFGGECVMTRADHANGTSRLAEAAAILGLGAGQVIVNVQGDEPELEASVIDRAVGALEESGAPMATVAAPFADAAEAANPNIVKVVCRRDGRAMYFSRSVIPFDRDGSNRRGARQPHAGSMPLRHIGLYAYRREFLDVYVGLSQTPLEASEQLEQLRALEHGYEIAVAVVEKTGPPGIDTPEQYREFVARFNARRR
jgi:3-deoxy-manno-octulosonate cytidylyltransferase (CMP-KDO synthetase)